MDENENQQAENTSQHTGIYDHVMQQQENTEPPAEETRKPWEPRKSETPGWARKRFSEYSHTVRELKQQNEQLMGSVRQILEAYRPQAEPTREELGDEKYLEYLAEKKAAERVEKMREDMEGTQRAQAEAAQLREADARNVASAIQDLPDYHEAIASGDPDIRLSREVVKHLHVSPAGPYVRYRMATDDELAEALKSASPAQRTQIIAQVHDQILEELISRQKQEPGKPQQAPIAPAPASTNKAPVAPRLPQPPRSSGRGSAPKEMLALSGDDYIAARNKLLRGK